MKWMSLSVAALVFLGGGLRAAEPSFTAKLSPEEMHRAGLDKLTPDERAELDRLVAGTKTVVKEVVKTVEVQVPAAEPTEQAVAKRATQSASAAEAGGWLNWLHPRPKTRKEAALPPVLVIETRIAGKFSGWDPRTVFHLANGQLWAVSDGTTHNLLHPIDSPEVRITPQAIFGYLLEIPAADAQTRVRPLN